MLLTGDAKASISGMGYSERFYDAAWRVLQKKFGRPNLIVDAQLQAVKKAPFVQKNDSKTLIQFSVIVSNFVNVLREYKYLGDLESCSTLDFVISKLPARLKEEW